jgi:hypothetical protein
MSGYSDGLRHGKQDLASFVVGILDEQIPDEQKLADIRALVRHLVGERS